MSRFTYFLSFYVIYDGDEVTMKCSSFWAAGVFPPGVHYTGVGGFRGLPCVATSLRMDGGSDAKAFRMHFFLYAYLLEIVNCIKRG